MKVKEVEIDEDCFRYVLLFGVDASCNHLQVEFLFRLYHDYLRIIFFLCRVSISVDHESF